MMIRILCVLFGLLLSVQVQSATLFDLVTDLRQAVGEEDTTWSSFSDTTAKSWINMAQDKINRLGGYIEKTWDHTYADADTFGVVLPTGFKSEKGAIIWVGDQWEVVVRNDRFQQDASTYQYYVEWKNKDTARIYFKGSDLHAKLQIRFTYLGNAANLTDSATVCEVEEDLQVFITEEAVAYYLKSQKQFQAAFAQQQQIRQDMGIELQKTGQ